MKIHKTQNAHFFPRIGSIAAWCKQAFKGKKRIHVCTYEHMHQQGTVYTTASFMQGRAEKV